MTDAYVGMLRALFSARRLGVDLGLDRMRRVLGALGHPERRLGAVVHVGGTNGKGSTAAFVESMLRAAGLKTGLYTSPHLCRLTERVRVDGREVDGAALAARWERLRPLAEAEGLTFFEMITALALGTFADAGVEATVLEVGLGGRLDATNVVDADVAVVTGVALDHVEILGPDVATIAREKAGIFKAGRLAVVGAAGEAAGREVLFEEAARRGVRRLARVGDEVSARVPASWTLGLRGEVQRGNAACAVAALDALEEATGGRVRVGEEARRRGLAEARWPGRLEEIAVAGRARLWLDGAHNADGARALGRELGAAVARGEARALACVVSVSADKDVAGVLAPVVAQVSTVVVTSAPSPRAAAPEDLAAAVAALPGLPQRRVTAVADPLRAVAEAQDAVGPDGLVVVFGSLFLVGAVRAALLGELMDPLVVQDPAATTTRPSGI